MAICLFQFNRALVFCSCSIYVKCRYPSQVYGSMMGIVYISLGKICLVNTECCCFLTDFSESSNRSDREF